jgi:hypothetical protein
VRYRACFAVDGGVLASGGTFFWNTRLTLTILNTVVYKGLVVVSYAARDKEEALYIKQCSHSVHTVGVRR